MKAQRNVDGSQGEQAGSAPGNSSQVGIGHLLIPSNFPVLARARHKISSRNPWTARRSNQSILKETDPEYSLEGLTLKLKLILWPPDANSRFTGNTLILGKIEGRRRRGQQRMMVGWHHQLNGHEFEQSLGDSEGQRILSCYSPRDCKELDLT